MSGYRGRWPVWIALLALAACTAPRVVSPVGGAEPVELRLRAGDTIRIVTRQRERLSFEIAEIRPSELAGVTVKPAAHETLPAGRDVVVPYDDIALVEVRRFSAARTAAGSAVVLLTTAGLVLATMPVMAGP